LQLHKHVALTKKQPQHIIYQKINHSYSFNYKLYISLKSYYLFFYIWLIE